jgi:ribonuclease Z
MKYLKFLGTSATKPSSTRNVSCLYFKLDDKRFLLDCGEGAQRQIIKFKESFNLDFIVITHLHADHFLGLFSILETLKLNNRVRPILIYSPKIKKLEQTYCNLFKKPKYTIKFIEILENSEIIINENCKLTFIKMNHTIDTYGCKIVYSKKPRLDSDKIKELGLKPGKWCLEILNNNKTFIQNKLIKLSDIIKYPGYTKVIFYTSDTRPIKLNFRPNILIHECTYLQEFEQAIRNKHTTYLQVLKLNNQIKPEKIILTHISERINHKIIKIKKPDNIILAYDGMIYDL